MKNSIGNINKLLLFTLRLTRHLYLEYKFISILSIANVWKISNIRCYNLILKNIHLKYLTRYTSVTKYYSSQK